MKRETLLLGGILGLAFSLRVVGVSFGLPHLYHADEPIVVNHALAYGTGDFNPHFFKIPPLVSYLLFVFYGLAYLGGRVLGLFQGIGDYETLFLSDPFFFYLSARILFGVFMGTAGVYLLYQLIRRHFSEGLGLLSAFFLAVAFLHVRDSHYVYADLPLLLILTLGFFPLLEITQGKSGWREHLASGAWIGLATATKYNGVVLFIPYLVSAFLGPRKEKTLWRLLGGGGVALVVYSLANPFTWLDFQTFWKEVSSQAQASGKTGWTHHFIYSLNGGIGPGLLAVGILGLIAGLLEREKKRLALISFILSYYFLIVFRSQPYDRYVLPLIPFLLFLAADFTHLATSSFSQRPKWGLTFSLAFLLAFPSLAKGILSDTLFLKKDLRTVAKEWVETSLPADSKLALDWDFFMPRLRFSKTQLETKLKESQASLYFSKVKERRIRSFLKESESGRKAFRLYFLTEDPARPRFLFAKPTLPYDLESLKREGIEYVLIARVGDKYKDPEFYQRLKKEGELVKRFTPYRDPKREFPFDPLPLTGGPFLWKELTLRERNGQPIELYRLK